MSVPEKTKYRDGESLKAIERVSGRSLRAAPLVPVARGKATSNPPRERKPAGTLTSLARAVARAEDVVLREAIFTSRRHGGMTNCGCKLCAAVCDYVLAARANAKKGRNKK